jgi:hypothetical protein
MLFVGKFVFLDCNYLHLEHQINGKRITISLTGLVLTCEIVAIIMFDKIVAP